MTYYSFHDNITEKELTMEFYRCPHCGNIIVFCHQSGVMPVCCGTQMQKINENTVDAAQEKHVPAVTREDNSVYVHIGSVTHPMIAEHYIEWIAVEAAGIWQFKHLHPNEAPEATFEIGNNAGKIKVYEYCNLHGLWSTEA
jgi:superoxide reductase